MRKNMPASPAIQPTSNIKRHMTAIAAKGPCNKKDQYCAHMKIFSQSIDTKEVVLPTVRDCRDNALSLKVCS